MPTRTEPQGPTPSPTLGLSPFLSLSPHPTDGCSETYQSLGRGASDHLHQVSKMAYNISHQTQWMGGREQHFLCTPILPSTPPAPYFTLLGKVGVVISFLVVGSAVLGIIFFVSLIGAGEEEGSVVLAHALIQPSESRWPCPLLCTGTRDRR